MNILEAIKFCDHNPSGSVHIFGRQDTRCNTKGGILTYFETNTAFSVAADTVNGWEVYETLYTWREAFSMLQQGKRVRLPTMEPGAYLKADPHKELVMYHAQDGTFSETSFMLEWLVDTWLIVEVK